VPVMIGFSFVLLFSIITRHQVSRFVGFILLAAYALYMYILT
jgi:Ca2+/Na+ antiporter